MASSPEAVRFTPSLTALALLGWRSDMYNFWQFLHVVSAIVWVGASALALFLSFRLGARGEDPAAASASRLLEGLGIPLFMVASIGTLATGLVMAFVWIGFEPLWIRIGLGGIAISLIMGFGYFKPHIEKLDRLVAERGATDAAIRPMVRQANVVALAELAIFLVVVWAMVAKP